jgi:hypothetical protein
VIMRAIVIRRCPACAAMGRRILSPMPIRITLTRARELAPSRKRALE